MWPMHLFLLFGVWFVFTRAQSDIQLPSFEQYDDGFVPEISSHPSTDYYIKKTDSDPIIVVEKGSNVELLCDIYGHPKPNITWYFEGQPVQTKEYSVVQENWGSKLVIHNADLKDQGTFDCEGKNLAGVLKVEKTLTVKNRLKRMPDDPGLIDDNQLDIGKKEECQKFSSQVCTGYLKDQTVKISHKYDQSTKELALFTIIKKVKELAGSEDDACVSQITQLLCYYNFPICLPNSYNGRYTSDKLVPSENGPIRSRYSAFDLCRHDCVDFTVKCSSMYDKLKFSLTPDESQFFLLCHRLGLEEDGNCVNLKNNEAILPNMTNYIAYQKKLADERFEERNPTNSSKYWPILITFACLFAVTGILVLICVFCRCAFVQNFGHSTRFSSDFQALQGTHRSTFFRPSTIFQGFKNFRNSNVNPNAHHPQQQYHNNNSAIPIIHNHGIQNHGAMGYPTNLPTHKLPNIINNNNSISNENPGSFDSSFGESFPKNQNPYPHLSHHSSEMNKSPMIKPSNQNYYNNSASSISQHHYQTVFGHNSTLVQPLSSNKSDFDPKFDKNHGFNSQLGCSNYAKFNQFNASPNILQNTTSSSDEHTPTSIELNSDIVDYNFNSIKFDSNLGHGLFGTMYNGEFQLKNGTYENGNDTLNYGETNRLFIKTLSPGSSGSLQVEFINEANVMNQLKHVNLLSLMGVSIHQLPWCMLFDITGYHELPDYFNTVSSMTHSEIVILQMMLQISSGLVYLSDKNFAHQDISARNILINPYKAYNGEISFTIKLTNLAFGRNRYSSDYLAFMSKTSDANNNLNGQIYLPIRWMSPESLISGKFTLESDVWSFGILIWELLTNCKLKPYFNVNEAILVDYIIEGGNKIVLPKLAYNVQNEYVKFIINSLYECLNINCSGRPKFSLIHDRTFNCLFSVRKNKKSLTESINSSLTHTTISSNSTVSSTKNFQN